MSKRIVVLPEELEVLNTKLGKVEKAVNSGKLKVEDTILSTEGVMTLLSVSRRCLQNWRDNGIIEYSAIKGKFYYRQSAIDRMLEKHKIKEIEN